MGHINRESVTLDLDIVSNIRFLCFCFSAEFEITVPSGTLIDFYHEVLILPCTFPVDVSWDLSSTVITWQRGLDVVHSFYYSRDQLDRQNPLYVKRTSLFNREMAIGNASLRLDRVTPEDAGVYTCSISTNSGSQKKSFTVNIAAFYSEPRLQFFVLNDWVNLLVTSEGGYPSPTLQWLLENSDITNQTQTDIAQDTHTGLYNVSSRINLTEVTNSSLTFILHNKLLGQEIRREIQLYSDKREKREESVYRCHGCVTLIPGVLLLVLIIISLMIVFIKNRRTKQNTFIGKETKALNGKHNGHSNIYVQSV
ncbi:programmed cell death 1 ligand 1-like [Paramisgurnus dabryanus]|uniref:programmed cell death 1 ligand 1-like n=1 Tax=Paramisgurnus dabryanus TaxID=90735 RepID=UPI0031F4630A